MSGEISWGGLSITNVTEILSTNPTMSMFSIIAFIGVVIGITLCCKNKTNRMHEQQKQRDTLRYQNPSEQRISGSTIGADAQVRQRMFNTAKEPVKQTIEDAQIRTRAKVNQTM